MDTPIGSRGGSSVYDKETNSIFLTSGYPLNDISMLKGAMYTWQYYLDVKYWVPNYNRTSNELRQFASSTMTNDSRVVVFGGLALAYGLNTNNTQSCVSSSLQILDIACGGSWVQKTVDNVARYGHQSIFRNGNLYVFGGSDGQLQNDVQIINLSPPLSRLTCKRGNCEFNEARNYCAKLPTCSLCGRVPYCQWCNKACASNNVFEQVSTNSTHAYIGQLDDGLCPLNYEVTPLSNCKQDVTLLPGQSVSGSLSFGDFQDIQVYMPGKIGFGGIMAALS